MNKSALDPARAPSLGVAMITKNAAAHLHDSLASVRFADRLVIVDSGSRDNTLAIAAEFGAQIVVTPDWPGFGVQKNRALERLDTDWVLALDADEVLSPELAAAIQAAIRQPDSMVYRLSRLSNFCGRWMHHSGWRPDLIPRLFRRGCARYSDDLVHERLLFNGAAPVLDGELLHYSFDDLDSVVDKMNRYSAAGAQQKAGRGGHSSLGAAIGKGLWSFVRTYVLRRGFLDGREGFILAVANAEGTYYRQLKLMYYQQATDRHA